MSSFVNNLKAEIARVARKELKTELLALRKTSAAHRSEIAALKRQVRALTSGVKAVGKATKSQSAIETPVVTFKTRKNGLGPARFAALRAKLGLTQAEMAKLIGASALSVHKWEKGMVSPRASQIQKIMSVMKLGKREARARLAK